MTELVYQIFVDRFARGVRSPALSLGPNLIQRGWDESPLEPPDGRDFYGGDLDGIAEQLDHVGMLGADAIYLTPIFRASSNHKYDTEDYRAIDPHFGGDAAFDRLVSHLRARSLGLVLDGVFNHVGEKHAWVTDENCRNYFRGSAWRGYGHLPELALSDDAVREELFGREGVVAYWIGRGATGWRLDCANDLGPEICRLATLAARGRGARDGTIGEVMAYPTGGHYEWTGALDGVMNYWLRSCALALGSGSVPAAQIQYSLDRLASEAAAEALLANWNILSSHDTPRIATSLGQDRARIEQAIALQFAYPGVPVVYYGEEIGMLGGADPQNRGGMRWNPRDWNPERLAWYKLLGALRRSEPALRTGRYLPMPQPGTDLVVFARVTERPADTLVFVANCASSPRKARLFLPLGSLFDALPLSDLLGPSSGPMNMEQGCLDIELPAHGARLLKARDDHPSGYRFFK